MKISNKILYSALISISLLVIMSPKNLKADIHPNVGEITNEYHKMVRPFYSKDFFPTEVNSIKESVKSVHDFQNAVIVGPVSPQGQEEKPTIYNTVITGRATSVMHPVPKMGNVANQAAGALFSSNPQKEYPVQKTEPGAYSIPVKLEINNQVMNDPTLSGYENPEIRGKTRNNEIDKLLNNNIAEEQIMMTQVREDVNKITSKLSNVKSNKQKIKILNQGKSALEKDANKLSNSIQSDVANLLNSKKLALQFNTVLAKYEAKIKTSQLSKLKLSDVITMKKQLIDKLTKEIQGFRTASSNYKELKNLDQNDIKRIIRKIKHELKY